MYTAVLPLQTLTLLEDTPAHRAANVRTQQSQTTGWELLSFFPVTYLTSTAPSLPALCPQTLTLLWRGDALPRCSHDPGGAGA